jgi:hypothetical protein
VSFAAVTEPSTYAFHLDDVPARQGATNVFIRGEPDFFGRHLRNILTTHNAAIREDERARAHSNDYLEHWLPQISQTRFRPTTRGLVTHEQAHFLIGFDLHVGVSSGKDY